MTNTLCPKIGAAQWTCTKDECTCHLKDSIGVRHGAALACATAAPKRLAYEEAFKRRPPGACGCDLDDRASYAAEHWEAMPVCPWSSDHGLCRDVRCTNCEHYSSGLRN